MNTAQTVSSICGDDGSNFYAEDGTGIEEVCVRHGADVEKAESCEDDDGNETWRRTHEMTSRTAVRYVFEDGSAIVVIGEGWDIEGETPFSWSGA